MFLIWTVYNTYKYMLVLCIKCKRMTTEKKGRKKEIKGHTQSCHQRRVFHSLLLFFIAAFPCDFFVAVQKHKKKDPWKFAKIAIIALFSVASAASAFTFQLLFSMPFSFVKVLEVHTSFEKVLYRRYIRGTKKRSQGLLCFLFVSFKQVQNKVYEHTLSLLVFFFFRTCGYGEIP